MRNAAPSDASDLFDGGPPLRLLRLWGRFDTEHRHVVRRALVVAVIGWAPLLVLAALPLLDGRGDVWQAFARDASVHARSLLVAPLLVLAEASCIPRLGAIARTFHDRGLVPPGQAAAYETIVRSIRWLRDWWLIEALAVVLAYIVALLIVRHVPATFLPDWHRGSPDAPLGRSLASWWNALVSLPLLLILILGWAWRLLLWSRYLWCVSRLPLRLVSPHPEGAAGLMFVSFSLRAFAPLGLAVGMISAATALAHIWAGGTTSAEQIGELALGTVVFVLVVFAAPLLVFAGPLIATWRAAVMDYGKLAQRVGVAFEDKWVRRPPGAQTSEPLSTGDFSAMTDLYQTMDKAYSQRLAPIELRSLLALAGVAAAPFAAVALALVPFDQLLERVLKFFL